MLRGDDIGSRPAIYSVVITTCWLFVIALFIARPGFRRRVTKHTNETCTFFTKTCTVYTVHKVPRGGANTSTVAVDLANHGKHFNSTKRRSSNDILSVRGKQMTCYYATYTLHLPKRPITSKRFVDIYSHTAVTPRFCGTRDKLVFYFVILFCFVYIPIYNLQTNT